LGLQFGKTVSHHFLLFHARLARDAVWSLVGRDDERGTHRSQHTSAVFRLDANAVVEGSLSTGFRQLSLRVVGSFRSMRPVVPAHLRRNAADAREPGADPRLNRTQRAALAGNT